MPLLRKSRRNLPPPMEGRGAQVIRCKRCGREPTPEEGGPAGFLRWDNAHDREVRDDHCDSCRAILNGSWQEAARERAGTLRPTRAAPLPPIGPREVRGACIVCGVASSAPRLTTSLGLRQRAAGLVWTPMTPVSGPQCDACRLSIDRYDGDPVLFVAVALGKLREEVRFGDFFAGFVLDGRRRRLPDAVPNAEPFDHARGRPLDIAGVRRAVGRWADVSR